MKPIWVVLITVIVTGGLVGSGTYYYLNNKATKDKDALQSQINDLNKKVADAEKSLADAKTDQTTTTADETANWKTYSNTQMGFSLKYPQNWEISATDETNGTSFNAALNPTKTVNYYVNISHTFLNYDNKGITAQLDYIKSSAKDFKNYRVLTGKNAVRFTESTLGGDVDTVLFTNGKYIIVLGYTLNDENYRSSYDNDLTIFNKVIDSLTAL